MQQKVLNVLGPLSKIWQKIEDSTHCKTDRVEIDLGEFKELTEQSVMMLGQVFNNITYNRRLSVLNALIKEHKSKQMSKRKQASSLKAIKSCLGRTSKRIGVLTLKPSRNTKKFCVRRPNLQQQHSATIDRPFEGALRHHHMEEVVEGVHHKHSSLE